MIVVGVTGGLGTGKSTVARMFAALGARVLDADVIAHEVMEPKRLAWRQIVETFGEEVLGEDGTIDRKALGERVFRDPDARRQLERIVHPRVIRHLKEHLGKLKRNRRVKVVVLDVPLLVEAGLHGLADVLVVVTAPPEVQRERLLAKGVSGAAIAQRIAAQMELSAKVALADEVIDNGDGLTRTRTQVSTLWNKLPGTKHKRRG